MNVRLSLCSVAVAMLASACVSPELDLTCDKPMRYQSIELGERIVAPEELDQLDRSREMPVPSASPRDPRPAGSPCLDLPPRFTEEVKVTDKAPE